MGLHSSQFQSLSKQTCRLFSCTGVAFWVASAVRSLIMVCLRLGMALTVVRIIGKLRTLGEKHSEKPATFAYFVASQVRASVACCLVLHRIQLSRPQKTSLCEYFFNGVGVAVAQRHRGRVCAAREYLR